MDKSPNRLQWVDSLKGIAIFFVALGHSSLASEGIARVMIYSFHLPLFFALAGITLGDVRASSLLRRVGGVLWVYFVIAFITIPFAFYGKNASIAPVSDPVILNVLLGILYGAARTVRVGVLWFLPLLASSVFVAGLIVMSLKEMPVKFWLPFSFACIFFGDFVLAETVSRESLSTLAWGSLETTGVLPWSANVVPLAAGFVLLGYSFSGNIRKLPTFWLVVACLTVWLGALLLASTRSGEVELAFGVFAPHGVASIAAIAAVCAIVLAARAGWLSSRAFSEIGLATLPILFLHRPVGALVERIIGGGPIGAIAGVLVGVLIPYFLNRYFFSRYRIGQLIFYPRKAHVF